MIVKEKKGKHFIKGETIITDNGFIVKYITSDNDNKMV